MFSRRVEVAGGGIAGLAVATLLARDGWKVRVHERSEELREIGAGIFIKNNGKGVLEEMGLFEALRPFGEQLRWAEIWDERGQLQRRELRGSAEVWNFPRQHLLNVLRDAAIDADVSIETGSTVSGAEPGGRLLLEGGQVVKANLVVAADGHRSVVRESLGLTRRFAVRKTGATRLLIPRASEDGVAHTTEHWSGHRRVGIAACTEQETYVYMSARNDDIRACKTPVDTDAWRASFPSIAQFFNRLEGVPAVRHPYSYVSAERWSAGAVVLVGDAAHGLPPTLGQGAGLSLINTWGLSHALRSVGEEVPALTRWERAQRPITDATQRWALRYDAATELWPSRLATARSAVIWGMGRMHRINRRMRVADRMDPAQLRRRQETQGVPA